MYGVFTGFLIEWPGRWFNKVGRRIDEYRGLVVIDGVYTLQDVIIKLFK